MPKQNVSSFDKGIKNAVFIGLVYALIAVVSYLRFKMK